MAFSTTAYPTKHHFLHSNLATILFFVVLFTIPALFLLRHPTTTFCSTLHADHHPPWSGDLRAADFSWNHLNFTLPPPPNLKLKIAVFSRKWPVATAPGGMERHAFTLHSALAERGHEVHVFTSPSRDQPFPSSSSSNVALAVHSHAGEAFKFRFPKAWDLFQHENHRSPFHVVHSESVALPHRKAHNVSNLVVTWHGIAYESLQSSIYQALAQNPNEPSPPGLNRSLHGLIDEIRFFHSYAHHVAISDSCGEILRDVYQIPRRRVHVIVNGVDENSFGPDVQMGREFRSTIGVPPNASLVLGVAGRLVKDKGHPILYEAFSEFMASHRDVYLIVAGSGPWEQRYRELGPRVLVLGSMGPLELRAFYNAIDVFVNPTLRPQGLDLTLMEAMMSGKPVMASRFPSIKGTVVVDDEFGFMFSPNVESLVEALEVVAGEGAERLAERGVACRKYAASMFTATKMALAYERLFLCVQNQTFCNYP
ncbi:unnamed protein product [Linum trigynum]|uniref:Glycosyltransferase subfamily 4-like N-terminal domain-containing protein n=1 Tax=Linum trigynum TaxID=586398 RepID=A0AAV2DL49_9ROSI